MKTEQAPDSCPFCGAGLNGAPQVGVMVFRCGTMVSHGNTHDEQSETCRSRESGGHVVATIKRLEADKAFLSESHLAQENKRLAAEMLELRNAIQRDTDAFLRLTRERDEEAAKADHLCVYSTSLETANRQLTKERDNLLARVKRLEEAGDRLLTVMRGEEDAAYCEWIGFAHDAETNWNSAKEAKP